MSTSNNATSAENQQERLIKLGWLIGFVDGEGCFSINFIKQPDRPNRKGYRSGIQVGHEFAVTQGIKSKSALLAIKKFFGIGKLYINKRYDNHKEHLLRYTVRRRNDLLKIIIPFFERYPLQTSKRKDFHLFAKCLRMIEKNQHLQIKGLIKIMKISEKMNHMKPKSYLIKILRNQTPKSTKRR